jgi:hypothetical protein
MCSDEFTRRDVPRSADVAPVTSSPHTPVGRSPDHRRAPVAQGIEHRFPKPCAAGSNPAGGTAGGTGVPAGQLLARHLSRGVERALIPPQSATSPHEQQPSGPRRRPAQRRAGGRTGPSSWRPRPAEHGLHPLDRGAGGDGERGGRVTELVGHQPLQAGRSRCAVEVATAEVLDPQRRPGLRGEDQVVRPETGERSGASPRHPVRAELVRPTELGREVVAIAQALVPQFEDRITALLGADRVEALRADLDTIREIATS